VLRRDSGNARAPKTKRWENSECLRPLSDRAHELRGLLKGKGLDVLTDESGRSVELRTNWEIRRWETVDFVEYSEIIAD
jgi:hypothetical protein